METPRQYHRPPKFGQWLLEKLTHTDCRYSALGDFEEIFCSFAEKSGRPRALLWYWSQILKSIPPFLYDLFYWSAAMFKNYLIVALRNIKKHKGYSFINITGLALGMAFTLLILLWVKDEIGYDRFHENAGDLHRVVLKFQNAGGETQYAITTPGPLAGVLAATLPEITNSTRLLRRRWGMGTGEKRFAEVGALVDPAFADMFSIEFTKGNPETALLDRSNIVITEDLAQKYFGAADPIGKTLRIEDWYDANITGVIKKIPPNSHLYFDYLIPFQILQASGWNVEAWDANNFSTYILLQKGVSPQAVNEKIAGLIKNHIPKSTATPISSQSPKSIFML